MKGNRNKHKELQNLQIIFNEIQICDNKKYTENLNSCIVLFNNKQSLDLLLKIFYPILLCKKSVIPSKIVLFIKRLFDEISTTENGKNMIISFFNHLFTLINSKTSRVRKNAIYFMKMLSELDYINEKVTQDILEKISERLFDTEKSVRKEAILFLQKYQNTDLNENTKIISLFKNLCKYDPSVDCRKLAYENLDVNIFTVNCIVDRCSDVNFTIRNIFYKKFLEKINIRELRQDKKFFLLKKIFTEREIDSIELFINNCVLYYDLPSEINILVKDFFKPSLYKVMEKLLRRLFNLFDFNLAGDKVLEDSSFESLLCYMMHLTHIEEVKGRDELNLPPLAKFVDFIYNFIKSSDDNKIEKSKILFSILNFYDVFDDESKKIINSTIYKLIKNGASEDIIEEVVKIVYKIDRYNGDKMFGALIHKHLESNIVFSLQIAKFILKYSNSIDEIQEAIANELIFNCSIENEEIDLLKAQLSFFYLNIKLYEKIYESFKKYKKNAEFIFPMIVDLAIKFGDVYKDLALEIFQKLLDDSDVSVLIPGSKLILSEKMTDESLVYKYFRFSLLFYFQEEDDQIQQYLNVFFHEYFLDDSTALINVFCTVYENLEHSEKYFVDRTLYLIENSKKQKGTQILFYNICVNLYLFYSNIKLAKKFLYVLKKINIVGAWDTILTKKILFCCTHLIKKPSLTKKMTIFVNNLMAIDDGEPINQEDLKCVKRDLCISEK